MPNPRAVINMMGEARKALLSSRAAATQAAEQLGLPMRSIAKGFSAGEVGQRLARAEKQGFDVANPLFHGTAREGFRIDKPGGIFLTEMKDASRSYANAATHSGDHQQILPFFKHKDAREFDARWLDGQKGGYITDEADFIDALNGVKRGRKTIELFPGGVGDGFADESRPVWQALEAGDTYRSLGDLGYDTAKIFDQDYQLMDHTSERILNPNAIRSAFAEFNPKFAKALHRAKTIPTWLASVPVALGISGLTDEQP